MIDTVLFFRCFSRTPRIVFYMILSITEEPRMFNANAYCKSLCLAATSAVVYRKDLEQFHHCKLNIQPSFRKVEKRRSEV